MGAHTVEHGYIMDEECMQLFMESDAWYVPTLGITHLTPSQAITEREKHWVKQKNLAPDLVARAEAAVDTHRNWFQQSLRSGVKMALGSDVYPLRDSALLEMGLWVKDRRDDLANAAGRHQERGGTLRPGGRPRYGGGGETGRPDCGGREPAGRHREPERPSDGAKGRPNRGRPSLNGITLQCLVSHEYPTRQEPQMTHPQTASTAGDGTPRASAAALSPPVAGQKPHSVTYHGVTIEDPWHWLRDPKYPTVEDAEVLAYLTAENEHFEAWMSPHRELTDTIFEEIKARQQPDMSSVPWKRGGWYYQWSYQEGSQYRVWKRWVASGLNHREAPPEGAQKILDEPALSEGAEYFRLGSFSVSNSGSLLAYSTDADGSERFRMVVKNLDTGEMREDEIEGTLGNAVWTANDASFFYAVLDENWRPWQVRRHVLGEAVDSDSVVYEEADPGFFVGLSITTSREYNHHRRGRPRYFRGAADSRIESQCRCPVGLSPADGA